MPGPYPIFPLCRTGKESPEVKTGSNQGVLLAIMFVHERNLLDVIRCKNMFSGRLNLGRSEPGKLFLSRRQKVCCCQCIKNVNSLFYSHCEYKTKQNKTLCRDMPKNMKQLGEQLY